LAHLAFGLVWLLSRVPGTGGPLLVWMQVLTGLTLILLALPLALRLARQRLLWSLRSKLILTYLLIGLAPVVLFVTLTAISAYIAAGQFSIHLADTRLRQELTEQFDRPERVEIFGWPDGAYKQWLAAVGDKVEVFGEADGRMINAVVNETPLVVEFESY